MKLEIVEYIPERLAHRCRLEDGMMATVDLFVNGDFPQVDRPTPESLVGCTIECKYIVPCEYFAMYVDPNSVKRAPQRTK